ncbi:MAG: gas vesicle protein GvpN [Myxococcota bacterium]|nr:gas vesicle protein GvpN [Myxococcota bacterium]
MNARNADPGESGAWLEPGRGFVETPAVRELCERALAYLDAGYPVHFSGPAGTGKTTLAFHVAAQRGRPVTIIQGDDDDFGSTDLVGADSGYRKYKLVDNYIHSVLKTEEELTTLWADNRLTVACREGSTLIYDEFTRSRPEANNVLLSVLEERLLALPGRSRAGCGHLEVHPAFRAIFTSNPEEYAGVHRTQDALTDRLITIKLNHFDRETEVEITHTRSGGSRWQAETIVDLARRLRDFDADHRRPNIRACIMVARILARRGAHAGGHDLAFEAICRDVLRVATCYGDGETLASAELEKMLARLAADARGAAGPLPARDPARAAAQDSAMASSRPVGEAESTAAIDEAGAGT